MNDRTTVIVGAGAVMDFCHKGIFPSVRNITDEVLRLQIQKVNGSYGFLIQDLNDIIIERLKNVGASEERRCFHPQLSFEDVLHVLELCLA